jgi:hypothetical protein
MIRRTLFSVLSLLVLTAATVSSVHAGERISEVVLFQRCYAHLTQTRPPRSSPLLAQVRAGTKTAVQACSEVLARARFTADGGTRLADTSDVVAKSVLRSMHQLHRSWARDQGLFAVADGETLLGSETWFDDSPIGDYITRALFSPGKSVDTVLSGSEYLQPVRATMSPTPSYRGVPSSTLNQEREFRLGAQHPFAPRGELLGVRSVSVPPVNWSRFGDLTSIPDFPNFPVPPTATVTLTEVNFPDLTSVRGPLSEVTQFAIWIRGQISIPQTGPYTFYLDVNDQGMLYIDGVQVLNFTANGIMTEGSTLRSLTAGTHTIQIRYRQRSGPAKLVFSWDSTSIPKQVVPASALSGLEAQYFTNGPTQVLRLTANEGGGFIGNHNYLLTTYRDAAASFIPDGRLLTNRSWARSVFKDALCRDVPVVRDEDVTQFVNANSPLAFRQNPACTSCHASLDRQAGLIRGLRYNIFGSVFQDSPVPDWYGILGLRMETPTAALRTDWSDQADASYAARPAFGHFYFRNYKGELVDRELQTMEELASAIRSQDDYYACFAKRYYYYFLGIDVDLGDPGHPMYRVPSAPDAHHRAKVIELGEHLKAHKSLEQLIVEILGSEEYRRSDYGISMTGPS